MVGVHAAHRLDGGGVGGFPDGAVGPGEIRGRGLENKNTKRQKHTLHPILLSLSAAERAVKKNTRKRVPLRLNPQQAPADKHALHCASRRSRSFTTCDPALSCWDIPLDPDFKPTMCPNTSRGATSSVLTAKACTGSSLYYTDINTRKTWTLKMFRSNQLDC